MVRCKGIFAGSRVISIFTAVSMLISTAVFAAPQGGADLAKARQELEQYKRTLLDTPEIVSLNKEIQSLGEKARDKDKELRDLIDAKLTKDPKYIALTAKVKELNDINAEINKYRTEAANDPEVQAIKKEISDLRAKAQALDAQVKKIMEAKFDSREEVKKLIAKKGPLATATKDAADYKNKIMSDAQIKAAQAASKESNDILAAKRSELKKITDGKLKGDQRLAAMEAKVKDLTPPPAPRPVAPASKKAAPAGMAAAGGNAPKQGGMPQQGGEPAGMAAAGGAATEESGPQIQPIGPGGEEGGMPQQGGQGQPAPQAPQKSKPEGLIEKIVAGRSEADINNLVSQYEQRKKEIEAIGKKLDTMLNKLPPDSKLFRKAKDGLTRIGLPNINPEMFKG